VTLAEFLLARIAEDEAAARMAGDLQAWKTGMGEGYLLKRSTGRRIALSASDADTGLWLNHAVRHLPARVLAECAAKRAIVEECRPRYAVMYLESERLLAEATDQSTMRTVGSSAPLWPFPDAEALLRLFAAPYADHPDFDPAWKV